jgi:uncharacterized protein
MQPIQITKRQLQLIQLKTMGLLEKPKAAASKAAIMEHIRSIGYLQIDTMQAVARAPYHILWSHVGQYPTEWLDELLEERALFEFWGHALCFLPIEWFPVMRGLNLAGERPSRIWEPDMEDTFPDLKEEVLTALQEKGPMCSMDFAARDLPDGWRNSWGGNKPEKHVMQHMWWRMELMVAYRRKFRRYYDLRERVLPGWDDAQALPAEEANRQLIEQAVKALGVATPRWAYNFYYLNANSYPEDRFAADVQSGRWIPLQMEDWQTPVYLHPENMPVLEAALADELTASHTTLLCPFDPVLTDRDRLEQVFDFSYSLECYVPKNKRTYGYFVLPILHNGKLIGRLDSKAWRKEKEYEVIALYLEDEQAWDETAMQAVRDCIWDFARWQDLETVRVTQILPEGMIASRIKELLETPL